MPRELPDVSAGCRRMIASLGRRVADESPEDLSCIVQLHMSVGLALDTAIAGLRDQGFTWEHIGRVLGLTRQGAQQAYAHINELEHDDGERAEHRYH